MKRRWLIPLVLVLVLAVGTFGASAYFNSARPTTGYISSGTLDLRLSNGGDWATNVVLPWDFSNMAPGDVVSGNLWMNNIGSIPARMVTFEWTNISNTSFADYIILTHAWDSKNLVDGVVSGGFGVADTNHDNKVSLNELAALNITFPQYEFDAVTDVDPFLMPNDPQYLHLEFQFDPAAENDLQGASLNYGLVITAEQVPVFP